MKHKIKNLKPKFIKLIVSILIIMIVISQVESGLSLNVVFAEEIKFEYDGIEYSYDSEKNYVYLYNADKTARLKAILKDGKYVVPTSTTQDSYKIEMKNDDGDFVESPDHTLQSVYSEFDNDDSYLDLLSGEISADTVSKATGKKIADTQTDSKKAVDKDKLSNDYAKYSFDDSTQKLTVEYYDPNSKVGNSQGAIKTKTYTYDNGKFVMDNPDNEGDSVYYQHINSDVHNSKHKVYIEIPFEQFEDITGISKDKLPSYMGEAKYDDSYFEKFVNGVAGFFLYPLKILPLLFGKILQTIMGIFTENNGALSVDDILFNRLDITKIDFFNLSTGNEIVDTIRAGVAEWYYGLRNISAVVLFSILIYVGLRMSLSTIAEEKAKYSQMIVNWIESIALLFVLHYLIILIISLNNQIVTIIGKNIDKTDPIDKIYTNAWSVGFVEGFGSAVCYLILVVMTFVFLLSYLKRMITIGFLIVIAPLVTITYSIDKMGDNKSQALGTWFKEFCYNILIQPFQCVSYIVLASSAMKILDDEASLSAMIVAIMMIMFVYESEKIIRHIFHFEARTMSETVSQAAFVGSTIGLFAGASGKKIDTSDDAIKEKNKKNEKTFAKMQENVENANLNSENTVKQNTTQNNANGSNASKHKRNHNVGNAISAVTNNRLAQSYANMARTGSKLLLQGGLALGTGNTSTFLNTEAKILRNGKIEGQDYIEERNKHELQQAYEEATEEAKNNMINNMVMKTMGVDNLDDLDESQQQIANRLKNEIENTEGKSIKEQAKNYVALRAKDIASGDDAKTQSEQKIKEVVNKLKRTYNKDGMSDKYAYSQINEDIANAKEGKYSKATHLGMEAKQRLDDVKEVGNIVKDTGNALGQSGKKFLNAVSTPGRKIQRYYRGKKQQ